MKRKSEDQLTVSNKKRTEPNNSVLHAYMEDKVLLDRIYHLNSYKSDDINGIVITGENWYKGLNRITISTAYTETTDKMVVEEWVINDQLHRESGPAETIWDAGTCHVQRESYYKEGKLHRVDGPACTRWNEGVKVEETWYINGDYRVDGPAHITWKEGKPTFTWYFRLLADDRHLPRNIVIRGRET